MIELLLVVVILVALYLLISQSRLKKRLTAVERTVASLAQVKQTSVAKPQTTAPKLVAAPAKPAATKTEAIRKSSNPWQEAADNSAAKNAESLRQAGLVTADEKPGKTTSYMLNAGNFSAAIQWAKLNWFFLVAAASLGLAGVFLVQYGVETGLLSPKLRVLSALALGLILILGGEYLRRKGGDQAQDLFAYLPSTFAAGGLLSLFAGMLSARVLYDLISAETALLGLAITGAIAVLIGWFYGPLLAAIGILGALLAPFLVGGDPGAANLLYYYFAVIAVVAMAVDSFKRWAWLSGFAAVLSFVAAANVYAGAGGGLHLIAFAICLVVAAAIIPERRLLPQQSGAMILEEVLVRFRPNSPKNEATGFPTRLLAGIYAACVAAVIWVHASESGTFWLSVAALLGLFVLAAVWMRDARALGDLAILPVLALPLLVTLEATGNGTTHQAWITAISRLPEDPAPWTGALLLAAGLLVSLIAAWRSYFGSLYSNFWALAAAASAPIIVVLMELFWSPALVIGTDIWAYQVIGMAAIMVLLAQVFGRSRPEDRTAAAYFTLAALTMISLALILVLSETALTLALAVMVLAAVLLDRKFNLPALSVFIIAGAGTMSWRLVLDPGIGWAIKTSFWEFFASYAITLLLLWAARFWLNGLARKITFAVVDGVFWSLSAVFSSILILRLFENYLPTHDESHPVISLIAMVWLVSAANQLWRLKYDEVRRWVRITLALFYGLPGFGMLALATTLFNPLFENWNKAFGPYIFDSLLVAYGLPALFFIAVAVKFTHLAKWLRYLIAGFGVFYAGLYVGLEIRRIWRGDVLAVLGTTDPELYTYTIVMLLASTGLLFYAFFRRSNLLRKIALAGIGLTVAKVFLIDVSGLTGLTRVFSFLVLGLSLAGLAWLDRWFGTRDQDAAN